MTRFLAIQKKNEKSKNKKREKIGESEDEN